MTAGGEETRPDREERIAPEGKAGDTGDTGDTGDVGGAAAEAVGPGAAGEVDPGAAAAAERALTVLRERIQAVDTELVRLVGERRSLVLEVGRVKAEAGMPVLDPSQEARVVRRAAELARAASVDEELVRDVIWRIIASARDAQEGRTRWGPPLDAVDPGEGA